MSRLGAAAIAVAMLTLAGCGGNSAPTTAPAVNSSYKLGEAIVFTLTAGPSAGTITFRDVVALPAECLFDPLPPGGQAIAIHAAVDSPGDVFLPEPDPLEAKVVDRDGATQSVSLLQIRSDCKTTYPDIAQSRAHSKVDGWTYGVIRQADPTAIVYTPLVGAPDSSINNLKFVTMAPKSVTVAVPMPLTRPGTQPQLAPASAVAPTPAPQTITAPIAGRACDPSTDRWAKDASGGQLRCISTGAAATWVSSMPFIGTRTPGTACELGAAVAESASGQMLVCTGTQSSATWAPGP
jgi:hypothetical protein